MAWAPVMPGSAAYPELMLEWAPTTKPTDSAQTYVDITSRLREWSWGYGRNDELAEFEPGRGYIVLDNRDRSFDPTYTGELVNLCPNPSFEVDTSNWVTNNVTLARDSAQAKYGSWSGKVTITSTASTPFVAFDVTEPTFAQGTAYTATAWVYASGGAIGDTVEIQWSEEGGATGVQGHAQSYVLASGWNELTVTGTVNQNDRTRLFEVVRFLTGSVADVYFVDGCQFEQAAAKTEYIDGSLSNGRWEGTAHASRTYRGGQWYGNVKPRKMFRMQYRYNGVTYPGFVAYARGFPQEWPGAGADSLARVDLVDNLSVIQGIDLVSGFTRPAELSSARVGAVLDAVGVPAGLRDIDTGTVTVAALDVTDSGTSGLAHAKTVAADENGQLFSAKDGKVTFHNRTRRLNQTSVWTFTDNPAGNLRYDTDFSTVWDDTYLWNYVRVDGPDPEDTPGIASDSTSDLDYFTLTRTFASQLVGEPDRTALAEYQVLLYKQPTTRAPSINFQGARNPAAMWPALLDLEVSDRVTVQRYAAAAVPTTLTQNVEGIAHTCRPGGPWVTTVATSPADTTAYWVLESGSLGAIDSTNLIAP